MATIQTIVRTFFSDGTYRNNTIECQIPDEAAEIIRKAWTNHKHPMSQSNGITAHWLAKNQSAHAYLKINDKTVAGISNMIDVNTQSDKFTYEKSDEEDLD